MPSTRSPTSPGSAGETIVHRVRCNSGRPENISGTKETAMAERDTTDHNPKTDPAPNSNTVKDPDNWTDRRRADDRRPGVLSQDADRAKPAQPSRRNLNKARGLEAHRRAARRSRIDGLTRIPATSTVPLPCVEEESPRPVGAVPAVLRRAGGGADHGPIAACGRASRVRARRTTSVGGTPTAIVRGAAPSSPR